MIEDAVVWIRWVDSHGNAMHWMDRETAIDEMHPAVTTTVGFCIHETEEFLTVVQSRSDSDQVHNLICIPRGCIIDGPRVL